MIDVRDRVDEALESILDAGTFGPAVDLMKDSALSRYVLADRASAGVTGRYLLAKGRVLVERRDPLAASFLVRAAHALRIDRSDGLSVFALLHAANSESLRSIACGDARAFRSRLRECFDAIDDLDVRNPFEATHAKLNFEVVRAEWFGSVSGGSDLAQEAFSRTLAHMNGITSDEYIATTAMIAAECALKFRLFDGRVEELVGYADQLASPERCPSFFRYLLDAKHAVIAYRAGDAIQAHHRYHLARERAATDGFGLGPLEPLRAIVPASSI